MPEDIEVHAILPEPPNPEWINANAVIPYQCSPLHILQAMQDFTAFLGFINTELHSKNLVRLESLLMPANFSSIVGEFMSASIPKYCPTIVKNNYHNGHPDLIPAGQFKGNAIQHTNIGIEIKGSHRLSGWQGHNPEDIFLMVFVFDANGQRDTFLGKAPRPFRFLKVLGAQLTREDWQYAGRSETSRRTITATVKKSGYVKMTANWIYSVPTHTFVAKTITNLLG